MPRQQHRPRPVHLSVVDEHHLPTPRTEEEQLRADLARSLRDTMDSLRRWLTYIEAPRHGTDTHG